MNALFHLHGADFQKCGVATPLITKNDSCIRRLERYCVLCALLLLQQKVQSQPVAVQITNTVVQSRNDFYVFLGDELLPLVITQASGIIWFSRGRQLTFTVR
jgi:hypothetical protein